MINQMLASQPSTKPKILIVEDSRSNQIYLAELLHLNYILEICSTGEEALELADNFNPDIILLDIVLPGIDGYEVCKQLRINGKLPHSKIIFISSQKTTIERLAGYHSGAEDYITKPFHGDELMAKIKVFLRLKSAEEVSQKLETAYRQTISSLVRAMEAKDEYTSGHSERVAYYACKLGEFIQLDPLEMQLLQWAGRVHDIGKIGIPDAILLKKGKLTDWEFEQIKTHPLKGYKVLEPVDALEGILLAVKYHHEHYDGSGYPDRLQGEESPLLARIIQIADVWDALTTKRPYRDSMSNHEAKQIMIKEAGTTMDPRLVTAFLDSLDHSEESRQNITAPIHA